MASGDTGSDTGPRDARGPIVDAVGKADLARPGRGPGDGGTIRRTLLFPLAISLLFLGWAGSASAQQVTAPTPLTPPAAPPAATAAPQPASPASPEAVTVRAADHGTYDRLVFDWARAVGSPMAYDYGFQRELWLYHYLTDWCGDDGIVLRMNV